MLRRFNFETRAKCLPGLVLALGCSGSIGETSSNESLATPSALPSVTSTSTAPSPVNTLPTPPGSPTVPGAPSTSPSTPTTTQPPAVPTCQGDVVTDAKRVVRLSFYQVSRSLHALLGDELGDAVDQKYQIGPASPVARTFPPLASPQEGGTINTGLWQKLDLIANFAGDYVFDHLAEVTGCPAPTDTACTRAFAMGFAERAFRHPLTDAEATSFAQVYDDVEATFGDPAEAVRYSVYAALQAPQFLYRTELGANAAEAGPLSPYELAGALSYFLTDGPPDAELLVAAANNGLVTSEQIGAHVDRMLQTPQARANLETAMFSYFKLDNLVTVKIDEPSFSSGTPERPYTGVRESAYHEAELFLAHVLWNEPLTALLTADQSFVNTTLASFYGVTVPGTDENQFVQVELPANRSGILTQIGFLASNSRPDVPSVVARGLAVNSALLCGTNPPFPETEELTALIEEAALKLASASEREKADYRTTTSPCLGCHTIFDAYGLALDSYDIVGRFRTEDPEGRPIDPSVTLPQLFDNEVATNAVEMQTKIAANPSFDACFSRNMMNWALAEGSQLMPTSCATEAVADAFAQTDKTFSALLKAVALSQTFTQRNAGVSP